VKSIDPGPPTLVVIASWNGVKEFPYADFEGTTDVMGLTIYPCTGTGACDYVKIDAGAAVADRLGITYWGVIQGFGDTYYRMPTPEELHEEFRHWRATSMAGYLVFAWQWPPGARSTWLANRPDLLAAQFEENTSGAGGINRP
jgi:hypothetical protein